MKKEILICDACKKVIDSPHGMYQIQIWFSPGTPTGSIVKTFEFHTSCFSKLNIEEILR